MACRPRRRTGAQLAHYAVLRAYGWPRREAERMARRRAGQPIELSQQPYPARVAA